MNPISQLNRLRMCLLVLCVVGAVPGMAMPAEAQTVPTCSQAHPCTLQWQPNTEEDMAEYRVFVTRTQGAYDLAQPVAVIAHPAAEGSTASIGTLQDGQYFVAVVAVDQSGNVSGLSNEAAFLFDGPPGSPVIRIIRVTVP